MRDSLSIMSNDVLESDICLVGVTAFMLKTKGYSHEKTNCPRFYYSESCCINIKQVTFCEIKDVLGIT